MLKDNIIQRRAENLSLEELEAEMEGFRSVCAISMLTEHWNRREETMHKWRIYDRVYKMKGWQARITNNRARLSRGASDKPTKDTLKL